MKGADALPDPCPCPGGRPQRLPPRLPRGLRALSSAISTVAAVATTMTSLPSCCATASGPAGYAGIPVLPTGQRIPRTAPTSRRGIVCPLQLNQDRRPARWPGCRAVPRLTAIEPAPGDVQPLGVEPPELGSPWLPPCQHQLSAASAPSRSPACLQPPRFVDRPRPGWGQDSGSPPRNRAASSRSTSSSNRPVDRCRGFQGNRRHRCASLRLLILRLLLLRLVPVAPAPAIGLPRLSRLLAGRWPA